MGTQLRNVLFKYLMCVHGSDLPRPFWDRSRLLPALGKSFEPIL